MKYKIKIMVVDDHSMVATGLAKELDEQPDFQVIDVITFPMQVMDSLAKEVPDVMLMDIRMGAYNGIKMADEIKRQYPEIKIVLMSGYNMGQLARGSKADAFASKEEPIEVLSSTIRKVCLESVEIFPVSSDFEENLTNMETEVLKLMGEDLTRKEIAAALYISEKTVANHISAILRKLNVRSRIGAVLKGIELGIVDSSFV